MIFNELVKSDLKSKDQPPMVVNPCSDLRTVFVHKRLKLSAKILLLV